MASRAASWLTRRNVSVRFNRVRATLSQRWHRIAKETSPPETGQCWLSPLGAAHTLLVDEKMASQDLAGAEDRNPLFEGYRLQLLVLLVASAIYLGCVLSPPSLMDDVDAVQAQIAKNMLTSGDWVTARLDGVLYLEKAPLIYWLIAISYKIFGVHDWASRIPVALSAIALCWLTVAFGVWAFGKRAGLYAG